MGLNYLNLDAGVREFMVEEIDMDVANGTTYISAWLTDNGKAMWSGLLKQAATDGSDDSLAAALVEHRVIATHYQKRKPRSVEMMISAVPHTAPATMSEGEFNRYYVRGVCRYAIANGIPKVIVYRAKAVANPRSESEAKIGMAFDPAVILADLRATQGLEPALGLPPGPNSGLCIRLP